MTTKNTVEDHDEQSHIKNSIKNNEVKETLSSSDNVTSKETEKSEPETYANAATNSNSDKETLMKSGDEKCNDKQSPDNALNHKEEMKRKQSDEPESANVKKSKSDSSIKVSEGEIIPQDIEIDTNDGQVINLYKKSQESGIVIFFYPKANTPGCTKQACGFRDNYEKFKTAGYEVYGMSADKPTPQTNWKNKHTLPYSLFCDPTFEILKRFGVFKAPKSVKRSHVIIEKGGMIGPIEKKYAQALFNVSLKMNSIPNTSEELGKIKVSMETNEKMRLFVEDPSVGPEKKRTIIQSMLKSYSPTVKNFFDTLLTNGRLPLSMSIINAFEDIVKEHRKEMIVKIVSAKELDSKYLLQLQDIISKNFVDKGKNITFVTSIKQEILGGVIVEVGDKTLDLSILNKVNNMKKSLEQGF
ncbi:Thioredoxin-like fold domain-containing protein [Rozella allomycis CSF55]|uniref:ATP synthase subunit 5, mitochondrial n=1 Tax=Rozella allomycis (strain CSF55) TaxID=988480 RepID=A0A075AUU5_ROZAC|nr:Thioredoxin-like fold domain-containing protein [Rozella allomycis CSF55]|eukprot:EPZ32487.1 Thioredoxin-like fold domain-containing protein [Rozella allomycis CSF55]